MVYMHEMPDGGESVDFSSLPLRIRELIEHLWETNLEICSPFGSTSDHNDEHDQIGEVPLVDQRVPDDSEDQESLESERRGNQAECEHENSAENEKQDLLNSSLSEQVPEVTAAAPETSEEERKRMGRATVYEDSEGSAESQFMVYEGNHTPAEIDASTDWDYDSSRTISDWLEELKDIRIWRRENVKKAAKNKNNPEKIPKYSEKQSFRFLLDVHSELKDEHLEIPDEYVDIYFPNKKHRGGKTKAEASNHAVVDMANSGAEEEEAAGILVSLREERTQTHDEIETESEVELDSESEWEMESAGSGKGIR